MKTLQFESIYFEFFSLNLKRENEKQCYDTRMVLAKRGFGIVILKTFKYCEFKELLVSRKLLETKFNGVNF